MDIMKKRRAALSIGGALAGLVVSVGFVTEGCSSDDNNTVGQADSGTDTSTVGPDAAKGDTGVATDGGKDAADVQVIPCTTTLAMLYDGGDGGGQLISGFDNAAFAKGNVDGWIVATPGDPSGTTAALGTTTTDGNSCPGAVTVTAGYTDYTGKYGDGQVQLLLHPGAATPGDQLDAGSTLIAQKLHFWAKLVIPDTTLSSTTLQATFTGVSGIVQWDAFGPGTYGAAPKFLPDGAWHEYVYDLGALAAGTTTQGVPAVIDAGGVAEFSVKNLNSLTLQLATQPHLGGDNPHNFNGDPNRSNVGDGGLGVVFDGGNTVQAILSVDDVWIEGPGATYVRGN